MRIQHTKTPYWTPYTVNPANSARCNFPKTELNIYGTYTKATTWLLRYTDDQQPLRLL